MKNKLNTFTSVCIFIGLLAFVFALSFGMNERAWHAYLLSYFYFILLSLGGLFFVSIHHVTNASWSVFVKRLAEALTAYLPYALLLTLPLIYGACSLYDWLDPDKVAQDALLLHKKPYLNFPFFVIRLGLFLGGWAFFAYKLCAFSLKQDQDGKVLWSQKSVPWSVGFLFFFALSLSLFSVDLIMSLDAHWFSTIFGVYVFAGLFQTVFAVLILMSAWLRTPQGYDFCITSEEKHLDRLTPQLQTPKDNQHKKYQSIINENHLHDMGKYLFASTLFWAYIAFSQYMLIWYANLPEETTFFLPRSKGVWAGISLALIFLKFIVPFLLLLPRGVKRNWKFMVYISALILFMQFIDLYWLIYPHFDPHFPWFGWLEIAIFLFFASLFIRSILNFLKKHSPVPLKDPRAGEALSHKVTY